MFFAIFNSEHRDASVMEVSITPRVYMGSKRQWYVVLLNPKTGYVEMTAVLPCETAVDACARRAAEVAREEVVDTYFTIREEDGAKNRFRTQVRVYSSELEAWKWLTRCATTCLSAT